MEKDNESFRDRLISLAELTDNLENNFLLKGGDIKIHITLPKEKYFKILYNFRDIDRNSESFLIDISGIKYEFTLEK